MLYDLFEFDLSATKHVNPGTALLLFVNIFLPFLFYKFEMSVFGLISFTE